ncbi:MFS transporter [Actinomadura physcomitrii]|uniref:MFS transporter n=1 Tax=Actinomadura physcomitrii TaxID=2650748 RepID=UPI00136BDFD2|nr:MFS transporter [Actinomadura physcomitrii]
MVELSKSERTGPSERPGVPWRLIGPTVLVPNLLNSLGQSATITAVPLAASALTRSFAIAALVAALITLGQLASTLPAGWVVDRFSERTAMVGSTAVTAVGGLLAYIGSSIPLLGLGAALIGAGVSVFAMARHAWITVTVPVPVRGRTLSAVAGFTRLGNFLGPFLAAAAFHVSGRSEAAFLVVVGTSVGLLVLVAIARFPESTTPTGDHGRQGVLGTLWNSRRTLFQLGLTVSVISSMRTGRRVLVPLIGVSLGWDNVSTALLLGVTGALDFAVCYLGGSLVDRVGRIHVAVGTLVAFGLSHLAAAVALVAPASDVVYIAAVAVMSTANGISGGLVPTIGSDLADPNAPATFLSSWRLVTDAGGSVAPIAVAAFAGALGLGSACLAMALTASVAAGLLPRYARRHLRTRHPQP